VAQHDLPKGSRIATEDFRQAQANALQGGTMLVSDPKYFSQYLLARPLKVGEVLAQSDVEEKKLVYKGGKVMVQYAINGLKIQLMAVALEDGMAGATISVMNTSSHAHMLARIIDQNNLEFIQAL
jgi:flagella basal body P-ring formation protein FlgA